MMRCPRGSNGRSPRRRRSIPSRWLRKLNELGRDSQQAPRPRPRPDAHVGGARALFRVHRDLDLPGLSLMTSGDPNPAGLDPAQRKGANRRLIRSLLIMTAASFAFGWALVPLYDVFCKVAGIGNAEAKAGAAEVHEAGDPHREGTVE